MNFSKWKSIPPLRQDDFTFKPAEAAPTDAASAITQSSIKTNGEEKAQIVFSTKSNSY